MYPSLCMANNISRGTKVATVLHLDGCPYTLEEIIVVSADENECKDAKLKSELKKKHHDMALANCDYINTIFGMVSSPDENAVQLCHTLFGMPDFSEMKALFDKHHQSHSS